MIKIVPLFALSLIGGIMSTEAKEIIDQPHIIPPPVVLPVDPRADEKPISVAKTERIVEENACFQRVCAAFVFTNPNVRTMQGDFEFPLPEGAFVCAYRLELNGEMVPGVVCEKERARVAFENEVRKGVDPGLVEQVKGNVWKTRIFPLNPNTPRKAEVEYVVEKVEKEGAGGGEGGEVIYERDGDDIFCATHAQPDNQTIQTIKQFARGVILWDASLSRLDQVAADRAKLAAELPETGDWQLVVFANEPSALRAFTAKVELLKAIDEVVYDGGTDIAAALAMTTRGTPVLVFTDEIDTLAEKSVDLEGDRSIILGSRPEPAQHAVEVRKVTKDEPMPRIAPKPSKLLATVWAARRMQDLASQAEARKDEFLALGRRYGVAGPGLSLIVLETLEQWLDNRIEPPAELAIHAEWAKRRAAEDDPIAAKKAQADHEAQLLRYWEERVKWWKDPKPKIETPKSGLFDRVANAVSSRGGRRATGGMRVMEERSVMRAVAPAAPRMEEDMVDCCEAAPMAAPEPAAKPAGAVGSGTAPSVTLKAWDPQTPYLEAIKKAKDAYAEYLVQRKAYRDSPAFYLDVAGWFFSRGEMKTGLRIVTNLAEFKLESAPLWRTLGWRLREAAAKSDDPAVRDLMVRVFRHVKAMRGEEGQSFRDLATVLTERGKAKALAGDREGAAHDLSEAAALLREAAFVNHARRAMRRTNDLQVSVIALEDLNGLLGWVAAHADKVGAFAAPEIDAAYRRDLPVKLRIVMTWDADETDIDLHVLEPNGEECFYGHRRTAEGGFCSEDVTTGYGPEEYLKKDLERGTYKVLSNYFASHQTSLTGATTVQATVYTDWATGEERMQVLTLRLEKPKDKHLIGEVTL